MTLPTLPIRFYPQPDGCLGVKIALNPMEQYGGIFDTSSGGGLLEELIEGAAPSAPDGHDPFHGVDYRMALG